jgi:hypothetical protein
MTGRDMVGYGLELSGQEQISMAICYDYGNDTGWSIKIAAFLARWATISISKTQLYGISQVVTFRLLTMMTRVRSQAKSRELCGEQSVTGADVFEYCGFPCKFLFH